MNLDFNKKFIAVNLIYFFPIAYVIGPFTADLSITCIGLLYIASIYNKISLLKFEKYFYSSDNFLDFSNFFINYKFTIWL